MKRKKKQTPPPAETARPSWRALAAIPCGRKARVRLTAPAKIRGADLPAGVEIVITPREAVDLIAGGKANLLGVARRD